MVLRTCLNRGEARNRVIFGSSHDSEWCLLVLSLPAASSREKPRLNDLTYSGLQSLGLSGFDHS